MKLSFVVLPFRNAARAVVTSNQRSSVISSRSECSLSKDNHHNANYAISLHICIVHFDDNGNDTCKKDYYDILGVSKDATERQIKKAFHKLAMQYHPDRNKSPDAEAKFREVAEAYETLSDEKRRREYDQFGHGTFPNEGARGGPRQHFHQPFNFNFDKFFKDFDVFEQNWHAHQNKHFENHFQQHQEAHSHHQDPFGSRIFDDMFSDMEKMFTFNSRTVRTESRFQSSTKQHCRTVTQRRGNMVNTFIDCSAS